METQPGIKMTISSRMSAKMSLYKAIIFCLKNRIFYLTVITVGFDRADPKTVGMLQRETVSLCIS